MHALRILGWLVGGLVGLVALLVLGVWLFVDPNDHRERIAAAVQSATGRPFVIEGQLGLQVWPAIALDLGRTRLGNPQGFPDAPFAVIEGARVQVRLWPLLQRRLEVDKVEIDGLDLRLLRNAQGQGNWEGFGQATVPSQPDSTAVAGRGLADVRLAGLVLTRGRLSLEGRRIEDLRLEVGPIAPGATTPVSLSAQLFTSAEAQALPLTAGFSLLPDVEAGRYRFTSLALQGQWRRAGAETLLDWSLRSPEADLDLAAHTLAPTRFDLELAGASAQVTAQVQGWPDATEVAGTVVLPEQPLRAWLARLGIAVPATRDAGVLASAGLQSGFRYGGQRVQLTSLQARLDDTRISGNLDWNLATADKDLALTLDRLALDRYLPPLAAPAADAPPGFTLPVQPLRGLKARGTLAIGSLSVAGLQLSGVNLGLSAADGVATFAPLRARLYGGRHDGSVTVDVRAAQPVLRFAHTLDGIDVKAVLTDFTQSARLSGRGSVKLELTGRGATGDALLRSLQGTASARLADGAVEGVDLGFALAQAQSLVAKRQLAADRNTKRTPFERFEATAGIASGVATWRSLAIHSRLLRVDGQGSLQLVDKTVDMTLRTTVLKASADTEPTLAGLSLATVPVRITGPLDDPKIRPDLTGMVRERARQELQEHRQELQDKAKDKLRDTLRDLLRR
jgi:AsmA protein